MSTTKADTRLSIRINSDVKQQPNEITLAAFEEGERMLQNPNARRFFSVDELFAELDEECFRASEDVADDVFCERMYHEYLDDPEHGDFVSFEEALQICGVRPDEI